MNIMLTGSKNSGKSRVIDMFLKDYTGIVCGYRTVQKKTAGDDYSSIYIIDLSAPDKPLSEENRAGICTPRRVPVCIKQVFETAGVNALSCAASAGIIIMDELGAMEEECTQFRKSAVSCLDSKTSVLGAIKKKNSDFLDSIRARRDIILLDLDIMSQETALNKIKEYLYSEQ